MPRTGWKACSQVHRYGLSVDEVASAIETAFAGSTVGRVFEEGVAFDLVVKFDEAARADFERIADLPVDTPQGQVPIRMLANVRREEGPRGRGAARFDPHDRPGCRARADSACARRRSGGQRNPDADGDRDPVRARHINVHEHGGGAGAVPPLRATAGAYSTVRGVKAHACAQEPRLPAWLSCYRDRFMCPSSKGPVQVFDPEYVPCI